MQLVAVVTSLFHASAAPCSISRVWQWNNSHTQITIYNVLQKSHGSIIAVAFNVNYVHAPSANGAYTSAIPNW